MEYRGVIFAVVFASFISSMYYIATNRDSDENKVAKNQNSVFNLILLFSAVYFVTYFLFILISDGTDHSSVYNNIKSGDPPF
jgi:hypothetical protein